MNVPGFYTEAGDVHVFKFDGLFYQNSSRCMGFCAIGQ